MKPQHRAILAILTGLVAFALKSKDPARFHKILTFIKQSPFKSFLISLLGYWGVNTALRHNGKWPQKDVSNKHVFVTGGGMGIGRQMSLMLARKGCRITIVDLNLDAASNVEQEIKRIGVQAQAFKCDISDSEQVKNVAQEAVKNFGPVDILINNAGIVSGKKILENSDALIEKTIAVNCTSHHYTVREFLPTMISRKTGHIVTIASIAGHVGVAGLVDYCASKFGAVGFDESLRMELKANNHKVKTTCICPFYINTGMFDGVQNKINFLVPILQEEYASRRIVTAILQNEEMVIMPWILYVIVFFKSFLPISVQDFLMSVTGMNQSMDKFKGRK